MRLVWRSTFIDVEKPPHEASPWSKSFSEPAASGGKNVSTEFKDERIYVKSLAEKAIYLLRGAVSAPSKKPETKECSITKRNHDDRVCRHSSCSEYSTVASEDATDAASMSAEGDSGFGLLDNWPNSKVRTDSVDSMDGFSVGSFGHPHLCERVCTYAAAGRCSSGSQCSYCHIPHSAKQVHLDKRNRKVIQAMSYEERAAMMLPILEQKAREQDFGPACEILLNLLASRVNMDSGCEHVPRKNPGKCGLPRVLTAMSFQNVLRHLLCGPASQDAPSTEDVFILVQAMRGYISQSGVDILSEIGHRRHRHVAL